MINQVGKLFAVLTPDFGVNYYNSYREAWEVSHNRKLELNGWLRREFGYTKTIDDVVFFVERRHYSWKLAFDLPGNLAARYLLDFPDADSAIEKAEEIAGNFRTERHAINMVPALEEALSRLYHEVKNAGLLPLDGYPMIRAQEALKQCVTPGLSDVYG